MARSIRRHTAIYMFRAIYRLRNAIKAFLQCAIQIGAHCIERASISGRNEQVNVMEGQTERVQGLWLRVERLGLRVQVQGLLLFGRITRLRPIKFCKHLYDCFVKGELTLFPTVKERIPKKVVKSTLYPSFVSAECLKTAVRVLQNARQSIECRALLEFLDCVAHSIDCTNRQKARNIYTQQNNSSWYNKLTN